MMAFRRRGLYRSVSLVGRVTFVSRRHRTIGALASGARGREFESPRSDQHLALSDTPYIQDNIQETNGSGRVGDYAVPDAVPAHAPPNLPATMAAMPTLSPEGAKLCRPRSPTGLNAILRAVTAHTVVVGTPAAAVPTTLPVPDQSASCTLSARIEDRVSRSFCEVKRSETKQE